MTKEPFKQHLQAARPFGCLLAGLFAFGMSFVVFVGSIMGDCEPGAGCHDHDGSLILQGLLWTLVIVMLAGAASWLVSSILRMVMKPYIGAVATNLVLVAAILLTAWFCFNPAMELLLTITG